MPVAPRSAATPCSGSSTGAASASDLSGSDEVEINPLILPGESISAADVLMQADSPASHPYRITNGFVIGSSEVLIHTVFGRV